MKIRQAPAITLGIVAAFALAACGSSSKASVSPNAQPSATTATTGAAPTAKPVVKPVVKVAMVGTVGSILVDDTGLTLYTLTKNGAPVACTAQCATFWPPLMLPAGTTTAVGDSGVNGLGTVKASGGGSQVTDNGAPLYRFSQDTGPGDAKGDGLSSFGGTWHVVQSSGPGEPTPTSVAPATPAPATTPTTTSGYGGY